MSLGQLGAPRILRLCAQCERTPSLHNDLGDLQSAEWLLAKDDAIHKSGGDELLQVALYRICGIDQSGRLGAERGGEPRDENGEARGADQTHPECCWWEDLWDRGMAARQTSGVNAGLVVVL